MALKLRHGVARVASAHTVRRACGKAEIVQRGLRLADLLPLDRVDRRAIDALGGRGALALTRLGALVDDDAADRAADKPANQTVREIRSRTSGGQGHTRSQGRHHNSL